MSMAGFARLALMTLTDTFAAWHKLTGLAISRRDRWLALAALVALSTLVAWAMNAALVPLAPSTGVDPALDAIALMRQQLEERPLSFAGIQFVWAVVLVGIITQIGRLFGGQALFDDVLLAAVWMKAILLAVQVMQLIFVHLSLPVATLLAVFETVLYLWLGLRLTQVAHGFRSPAVVAVGMVFSFFVIVFAVAIRLVLFGAAPPEF